MDRDDGLITQRPHVALIAHLFELWPVGQTFAPTTDLITDLVMTHPDQWGDGSPFGRALTAQRLGRMLATAYGVNSTRLSRTGPRGYTRVALERIWTRMGVAPVTSQPPKITGASGAMGASGAGIPA